MKISELIRENTENLINIMQKAEAASYRNTSCEYRVYIDSEGECGYEELVAGDNGWFEFTDPDYHRYYIHTFCYVRDWWFADPEEYDREAIMEAIGDVESKDVYEGIVEYAIRDAIEAESEADEENERDW